jgi:hypothetical protein
MCYESTDQDRRDHVTVKLWNWVSTNLRRLWSTTCRITTRRSGLNYTRRENIIKSWSLLPHNTSQKRLRLGFRLRLSLFWFRVDNIEVDTVSRPDSLNGTVWKTCRNGRCTRFDGWCSGFGVIPFQTERTRIEQTIGRYMEGEVVRVYHRKVFATCNRRINWVSRNDRCSEHQRTDSILSLVRQIRQSRIVRAGLEH